MDELKRDIERILGADPRVGFVLIFGSAARGQDGVRSDLDIAVGPAPGVEAATLDLRLDWMAAVSGLADSVDVVVATDAPPELAYRIARDGVVVLARDPRAVTRFRADAFRRHPDWQRFMAPHRRAMLRRLEEGTYGR